MNADLAGRPLPPGWRWARLGEVCEQGIESRDPRLEPDVPFRYVDISAVDNRTKQIKDAKVIMGRDAPSRARQVIRQGDVLVATTRPSLNAVALVPPCLDKEICSTGFCVLRHGSQLDPGYLLGHVRGEAFVAEVSGLVRGALYPAVRDKEVLGLLLPLPPLPEQRRIAAILDAQMEAVQRARVAAETRVKAAQALPAAFLRAVFESPEARAWPRVRLGEILSPRKEIVHPRDKPSGPATFVGLEHIEPCTGRRLGGVQLEMAELAGRKPCFHRGDIVYGYLRPYLNKVWVAEFDGLCSVDQYVYESDLERADPAYIGWFMRSRAYLDRAPISSTPGQLPRIRTEEVASVPMELPPLPEQRRIVAILDGQMAEADRLRAAAQAERDAVDALPAALLRRAFRGDA